MSSSLAFQGKRFSFLLSFSFLSAEPFISEKVNAQLDGFSSFMWSCFRLFEHETIFWSHSTLSVREGAGSALVVVFLFFFLSLFFFFGWVFLKSPLLSKYS